MPKAIARVLWEFARRTIGFFRAFLLILFSPADVTFANYTLKNIMPVLPAQNIRRLAHTSTVITPIDCPAKLPIARQAKERIHNDLADSHTLDGEAFRRS
jgi:hypothetical protein